MTTQPKGPSETIPKVPRLSPIAYKMMSVSHEDNLTVSPPASSHAGPKRTKPAMSGWLRDILISLAVSAFFIIFLYQPVKVEGTSMMPTLDDQERVFINKFVYKLEPIEHGDVVVFRYPRDTAKSYIKRVVAVAGDRVKIEEGVVFVNGHRIAEPYLPDAYEDVRSYPETGGAAALLFRAGRSSQSVQRQPRLRAGGWGLHLRQSGVWILANGQARQTAVVPHMWCRTNFSGSASYAGGHSLIKSIKSTPRRCNAGNPCAGRWTDLPRQRLRRKRRMLRGSCF